VCVEAEVSGVAVTVPEFVRLMREVSGAGAPICDFLGVSVGLLRLLELKEDVDDNIDLLPSTGLSTLGRRWGRMNG
jgi:hypothetical protein